MEGSVVWRQPKWAQMTPLYMFFKYRCVVLALDKSTFLLHFIYILTNNFYVSNYMQLKGHVLRVYSEFKKLRTLNQKQCHYLNGTTD